MAKFLILSKYGDFLSCASRLMEAGHDVKYWLKKVENRAYHEGLPLHDRMVTNWKEALEKDRYIIPDSIGGGKVLRQLKDSGYKVLGGDTFADLHELNRGAGSKLFVKAGLSVPPMLGDKTIDSFDEARELLEAEDDDAKFVFKPHGNLDTETTYVSTGKADMLAQLDDLEAVVPPGTPFELQRFISGIEVSSEGWFAKDHWIEGFWNHTWEEKKELYGNLGRNTGCAGNVVRGYPGGTRLIHRLFDGLTPFLTEAGYAGPIDLNCIVTPDEAYVLEGTFRFGYDAIQTLWQMYTGDWGDLLVSMIEGDESEAVLDDVLGIGVRVTVPFPDPITAHQDTLRKILSKRSTPEATMVALKDAQLDLVRVRRIGGYEPDAWTHLSAAGYDAENGHYLTKATPTDNNILTMTATGESLAVAKARVYDRIKKLELPDKQYREDVGGRVERDSKQLTTWEWID
jgi:phosphoribosylamine-glycine ligase